MKNRKLVLSLVALAGLASLSAQAQTNNTEKPHETIMQRVDTLAKKVGAAVKQAETTEKTKLNADKKRFKTDLANDKQKINKVYQDNKEKFDTDVKNAENGLAKGEQKVKNTYRKDKAKIKQGIAKDKQKIRNAYRKDKAKIKQGLAKDGQKIKNTYNKDKAKVKAFFKKKKK